MKRQTSSPAGYSSTTSYVEDIESVHPLELDDEGEGLPAYEESVASGLEAFSTGSEGGETSASHATYQTHVSNTARLRLDEKDQLKRNSLAQSLQAKSPASPSGASEYASSRYSNETSLPAYQSSSHPQISCTSTLTHSLSRKYGRSHPQAQITELTRTGLARVDFGSAYAQQSPSSITCALSLYGGNLVLFGTADGLRVVSVLEEVAVRVVWTGLPVWDMRVLRCVEEGGKTPKGSIAILCGGVEDPNMPGKPKAKGGEVEVRIWRLGSLASLAKWTSGMGMGWKGLDMTPVDLKKGKAKERSIMSAFGLKRTGSDTTPSSIKVDDETSTDLDKAKAWSADWIKLNATTNGKPADVLSFSLRQQAEKIYIAIATSTHILLHVGIAVASGVSFRSTRKFYLPFPPTAIGLIEVSSPSGEASLGIWINFSSGSGGLGTSMASVIRNSDSAVLDFKPPSGQGARKAGGGWTGMQNIWIDGNELYAFHRGEETLVYPSPLRLPVDIPPVAHTTWPRTPMSSLVVPDGKDLLLMTTSKAGEICTQRARSVRDGTYQLDLQDGTQIGEGYFLPLAWGYVKDGVYLGVKEVQEWRICAVEKG